MSKDNDFLYSYSTFIDTHKMGYKQRINNIKKTRQCPYVPLSR